MEKQLKILGITYGGHDTSATLMIDGKLVAACEEERYNKEKHTRSFPSLAINDCLNKFNLEINDIDHVAIIYDPVYGIRETYLKTALEDEKRINFLINDIEKIKLLNNIKEIIKENTGFTGKISYHLHHLCHFASSYFVSGFEDALLASYDGMGEIECTLLGIGKKGDISIVHEGNRYPHSLGLFYSAITHYLGWKHHSDEGIIMGLAPFGNPKNIIPNSSKTYEEIFKEIIIETGDYDFQIDTSWIAYQHVRDTWISSKFIETFGPKRNYDDPLEQHHKDIAAALQNRIEEIIIHHLKNAKKEFGLKKLCLAGGVGLNCSLNGRIIKEKIFDEIFVQPASGDNGAAIGACFLAHQELTGTLKPKKYHDFYLGSSFTDNEIESLLKSRKIVFEKSENIFSKVASELFDKKIIGWFQKSAEFGPRALGNRSILTSPFPKEMKDILNKRVKFREEFRPFAPAILEEYTEEYFEIEQESPHMLIAVDVKKEKINQIPAVVHIDNTARVQTVTEQNNPEFRKLLEHFFKLSQIPVLLNTSFNVKGQPIVNSPEDALDCFLSTNIDVLAMGSYFISKENQKN
tara:strand:+ start:141 stop:1871 length:1731 start_codon:yes stop_codon:yes gene_type:complete